MNVSSLRFKYSVSLVCRPLAPELKQNQQDELARQHYARKTCRSDDRSGDAWRSDLGTYWRPYVQAESDFGLIPRE